MPLPRAYRPDVVIPLDDDPARLLDCVQPVLEYAGPVMGRLVIYGARLVDHPACSNASRACTHQMITSLSSKAVPTKAAPMRAARL